MSARKPRSFESFPAGSTDTGGGGTAPPPQPVTTTRTYRPTQTASYYGDGRTLSGGSGTRRNVNGDMYQGAAQGYISTTGDQFSIALFNWNAIRADLSGASINWINMTVRVNHTWWAAGGYLRFGYGNRTDLPASGVWVPANAGAGGWAEFARGQTRTIGVTNWLAPVIASAAFTMLVFGPALPASNLNNYVVADGGTGGTGPYLTVNYTK